MSTWASFQTTPNSRVAAANMAETGQGPEEKAVEEVEEEQERLEGEEVVITTTRSTGTSSSSSRPFGLREEARRHDLAPIHSLLLDLAISLQVKVNQEIENIGRIRRRLSTEM